MRSTKGSKALDRKKEGWCQVETIERLPAQEGSDLETWS